MSEGGGAGGKIFMDIMAAPNMASAQAAISSFTKIFSKGSSDISKAFGSGIADEATATLAKAQKAWESTSAQMISSNNNLINSKNQVTLAQKRVSEAEAKWGSDSSRYISATNGLTKANQGLEIAHNNVAKSAAAHKQSEENLASSTAAATSSHAGLANAMNTVGVVATGVFAAGVGVAIDKAADFQQSTQKLVDTAGLSQKSLAQVSQGMLDLAGKTGYSAQDLSAAMYTVSSGMTSQMHASNEAGNALTILQAAAQGAAQEQAPLKEVTDAVTTALKDYNLPASEAANVTSQMVAAVSHGKMAFGEFTGALGQVQASAANAHESMTDLYAALGQMTSHGISAEQAAQNLNRTITTFQKPSAQMVTALSNIGINANDLADDIGTKGLTGTLQMVSDAIIQHMGPDHKVLINAFNQSKVAAQDAGQAYDALPPKLRAVADQVKAGTLAPTVGKLESAAGLDLDEAHQVAQWAALREKSTGLNSTLTGAKNTDLTYQQMLIAATGNQESARVAANLTGDENKKDLAVSKADIGGAKASKGGDVAGWENVQGNFNQQMKEAKASFESLTIELGTMFLPAATSVAKALGQVAGWLEKNKTVAKDVVIGIGAISAAFVAFKIGTGVIAAFNAVMEANPIVLVATALVGLGVAVYEAYQHWTPFRNIVNEVGRALKSAGEWIAHAAVSAWGALSHAADNVGHAFGNVEHAFGNIMHAAENVGHAFMNVERFISGAVRVIAAVVTVAFLVPLKLAFDTISGIVTIWWRDVVTPAFHAVGDVMTWLNENIVQPTFKAIGAVFTWINNEIIKPIAGLIHDEITGWGLVIQWLNDTIMQPLLHGIGDLWNWLYNNVIHPVIGFIGDRLHDLGVGFKAVYDDFLKPIGDLIGKVLDGLKTGFDDTVKFIDQTWQKVEKIVGTPVFAIVDAIYNKGIVPVWNDISGVFGLGKIDVVPTDAIPHYDTGGIIPGYTPGKDTHLLPTKSGGNIAVGGGEAIMRPEWTRAMGANYVNNANAAARSGGVAGVQKFLGGFDTGGIFGDVGNAISDVGHVVTGAAHAAVDAAKFTASLMSNPAQAIRDVFSGAMEKVGATPGQASTWLDTMKSIPGKIVDSVITQAEQWVGLHKQSGGGNANYSQFTGTPDLMAWIAAAEKAADVGAGWTPGMTTLIGRESGGNPNAVNNWDSNAAKGDPSRGLTQTIGSTFEAYRDKNLPDNIYDPVANIVAAIHYIQSTYGVDQAGDNLSSNVQQADPNRPPHGYSSGGIVGRFADGGVNDDSSTEDPTSPTDPSADPTNTSSGVSADSTDTSPSPTLSSDGTSSAAVTTTPAPGTTSNTSSSTTSMVTPATSITQGTSPAMDRANSYVQGVVGHPYTEGGIDDCSGVQSGVYQALTGGNTGSRAFSTISDFAALGFKSGLSGLYQIGVLPLPGDQGHMVGKLNGHRIESAGGKGVVVDGNALDVTDKMFKDHWYLPGTAWNPAFNESAVLGTNPGQKKADALNKKAQKYQDAAAKAAQEADKERKQAQKYLADAAKSQGLADKSMGAAKQRHLDAVKNYKDKASAAQARADKYAQTATDDQKKAEQAQADAKTAANEPGSKKNKKSKSSSSGSGSSNGDILSISGFFGKLGTTFGEGIEEETGADSVEKIINNSPFAKVGLAAGRIGIALAQAEENKSAAAQGKTAQELPLTKFLPNPNDLTAKTGDTLDNSSTLTGGNTPDEGKSKKPKATLFDDGGVLPPGLNLISNQLNRPEAVLAPREKDNLERIARTDAGPAMKGMVVIENQHINGGDEQKYARATARAFNTYAGSMRR